eukprot:989422-Amphidinium_carterae.1
MFVSWSRGTAKSAIRMVFAVVLVFGWPLVLGSHVHHAKRPQRSHPSRRGKTTTPLAKVGWWQHPH